MRHDASDIEVWLENKKPKESAARLTLRLLLQLYVRRGEPTFSRSRNGKRYIFFRLFPDFFYICPRFSCYLLLLLLPAVVCYVLLLYHRFETCLNTLTIFFLEVQLPMVPSLAEDYRSTLVKYRFAAEGKTEDLRVETIGIGR